MGFALHSPELVGDRVWLEPLSRRHAADRNARSRAALAGTGAQFEGVLRNWSQSWAPGEAGRLRDSAMFSVIAPEWPAARSQLRERLRATSTRFDGGAAAARQPARGPDHR